MRIARKMLLLALTAMAAMAMAASTASAQTVEITNEATGTHCGAVTLTGHTVSGGCLLHAASTSDVVLEAFGSVSSVCANEFTGRTHEDGGGYLFNQTLTGPDCDTAPCTEAGGVKRPWPATISEEGPGALTLEANFCVRAHLSIFEFDVQCELHVDVTVDGHDGATFGSEPERACENTSDFGVAGDWALEPNQGLELAHL
jgi:hypothetical protein